MTADADQPWCITAAAEDAGARLDRYLADRIGAISRTRIKALIEGGHLMAGGQAVQDASAAVIPGLTYRLQPPPPGPAAPHAQDISLEILFEDDDLLVIDKPAGLVVHPAPGNEDGTLVNAVLAHCGDALPGIGGERRPGIVHRLDKDTSGVMVVAKSELAMATLGADFARRSIERTYLALCWGRPGRAEGDIEGAIGRDPKDRKRMAIVRTGGKPALTRYRVIQHWESGVSLLACRLATGRTHQIRVHLASSGHPLVGDPVYLRRPPSIAKSLPGEVRERLLDFPRQALHANVLGFVHPRTGLPLRFETPLPKDFAGLLEELSAWTQPSRLQGSLTGPG